MKKGIRIFCLVLLIYVFSFVANADSYGELTYKVSNGKVAITDCNTSVKSVVIPETINGYPVTSIDVSAFEGCTSMTSVTIPSSVFLINSAAFSKCSSLESVIFENGSKLDSIGRYAFDKCTKLDSFEIPSSVSLISGYAFQGCTSLTTINIPNSVEYIRERAFAYCESLTNVYISESTTVISSDAFSGCISLMGIWVNEDNPNYSSDEQGILYNKNKTILDTCPGGKSIVSIPSSVNRIEAYAFQGNNKIEEIVIPSTVSQIGDLTFNACSNLKKVVFDENIILESIGQQAFFGCENLKSVIIPKNVLSINYRAFGYYYDSKYYGNDAYRKLDGFTLYGYKGSVAENYALGYKIPFVALDSVVSYIGHSLLLDGSIGVKALIEINYDAVDVDFLAAEVTLKNSDNDTELVQTLPVHIESKEKIAYVVVYIPPKDADNIVISMMIKYRTVNGQNLTYTDIPDVTVFDYIDSFKELAKTDDELAKALNIVNALEVYCDCADKFFDKTITIVEEIVLEKSEEENIKGLFSPVRTPDKAIGKLDFYGSSLILEGEIAIRHYFKINGETDISTYNVDGAEGLKSSENKDGFFYIDVKNIYVDELADKKITTISYGENKMTIVFSPIDYIALTYKCDDEKLSNLSKALYRYYIGVKAYTED